LITISCQRLLGAVGKRCSVRDALRMGNDVLRHAVQSIADLIRIPGVSTVDFADVHMLMSESGLARLGTSVAHGERRAAEAAEQAMCCPWLEDSLIEDARGLLINITGGPDMTEIEVHEAASIIAERAHAEAQVVCGAVIDEQMQGEIRVTVIATGVGEPHARAVWPARLVPTSQPLVVPRHEAPGRAAEQGASHGDDPQEPVDEATSAERPVQGLIALRACERVKPRLEAWMDGELDPAADAEIRSHLESCRTCQREMARDQRLTRLVLAQLSATVPPPHLWRTIVQQIEQERQIGGDTPPEAG
jgi:FtsZ family, C-terminal domain/Putative zinc-finger